MQLCVSASSSRNNLESAGASVLGFLRFARMFRFLTNQPLTKKNPANKCANTSTGTHKESMAVWTPGGS
eukprot:jgi/Chrzof1/5056/Cz15g10055.t1